MQDVTLENVTNAILSDTNTTQYKERIVEMTTGGEYMVAEDGTRITIRPGTTKVYIFYTDDINS